MANCSRSRLVIDGYAHELRPGARQLGNLISGRCCIGGVRVRHRLHDHRVLRPYLHAGNRRCYRMPAISERHAVSRRMVCRKLPGLKGQLL